MTILNTKSPHLSTISDALGAVHHHVDIGVGPSASDVSCHNLDVVHNTWRVQLHVGLSHTHASESLRFMAPVLPQELSRNQISQESRINDHRVRQQVKCLADEFVSHPSETPAWRNVKVQCLPDCVLTYVTFTCGLTSSY